MLYMKRCAFPEKFCNCFIFMILEFLLNALLCFHMKLWNCSQNPLCKALKPNTRVWCESFIILTNFLNFAPFAKSPSPGNFIPKALITSEKDFYASLECILESILLVLTTVKGLCIPHTHFKWHTSTELCLGNRGQEFLLSAHNAPCLVCCSYFKLLCKCAGLDCHWRITVSTLGSVNGWSYPYAMCSVVP